MNSSNSSSERRIDIAVPITKGKFTLISREDAWVLGSDEDKPKKWFFYHGKAAHTIVDETGKEKNVLLHREIVEKQLGRSLTKDEYIVHINGDELDNRRENLQYLTASEHAHRQQTKKNKSGYRGVRKSKDKWRATIVVHGKAISLGSYTTPEEAAQAYNEAAKKYYGEKSLLNTIPEINYNSG